MGSLRKELKDHFKFKEKLGQFGIEIETEVKSIKEYPDGWIEEYIDKHGDPAIRCPKLLPTWDVHIDSSLRNYGLEYVLSTPLNFEEACNAVDLFGVRTVGVKFLKDAPGTSVHVHINMADETALVMGNFLTTYLLYENILIEFSGELRRSNLFALPTRVAETTANNIARMFAQYEKADPFALSFSPESVKYAALNLACLTKLGSLEIRSMRGVTDPEMIKTWLGIIYQILVYARTDGLTPRAILRDYRHHDQELFDEIFGGYSPILRERLTEADFDLLIEKNLWYAKEVADSVKDWDNISTVFSRQPKVEKPKKVVKKTLVIDEGVSITNYFAQADFTPSPSPMWTTTTVLDEAPQPAPQPFPYEPDYFNDEDD